MKKKYIDESRGYFCASPIHQHINYMNSRFTFEKNLKFKFSFGFFIDLSANYSLYFAIHFYDDVLEEPNNFAWTDQSIEKKWCHTDERRHQIPYWIPLRLFEFRTIYNRAKRLAVILTNINAFIQSQSPACRFKDRNFVFFFFFRKKKSTATNDRRHIPFCWESLYYYFYVRYMNIYWLQRARSIRLSFGLTIWFITHMSPDFFNGH